MLKLPSLRSKKKITAQAMVEFALALPILLLVVYGLLETGRLLFIYASVVTAARQAARYGAASGDIGTGTLYYNDCAGIRAAANKVAFIQRFTSIDIQYDMGPGQPNIGTGCPVTDNAHPLTDNQHRIKIRVSAQFTPIVPLVPFKPFTITSTSNRTILTGVSIAIPQGAATIIAGGGGQLVIAKSADHATYNTAGITLNYTIIVNNPTSDPIVNINLSDTRAGTDVPVTCPGGIPFNLTGGSSITCHATDVTTQAEVDAAQDITNVAQAVGLNTLNQPVNAQSTYTVHFVATPKLSLEKSGQITAETIVPGTVINYTFKLTNTGNVTLNAGASDVFTIIDSKVGSSWNCPSGSLAPGASINCTGTYKMTSHDINVGQVDNSATATGKYGATTVTSNTATATVLTPELLLTLSANPMIVTKAGQTITYTYTLKNRSTSTMSNIKVSDQRGAGNLACVSSLAGGQTNSCTHPYTVTQADMDASTVLLNEATASAQGGIASNKSGVSVTVTQTPMLTLVKTASSTVTVPPAPYLPPGTPITYTYTLKNDVGNVTLTAPFTVTDNKLGAVCTISSGTLGVGASVNCPPATYTITQADQDDGVVINKATATGTFAGQTITSPVATALVKTWGPARMAILKTASVSFFMAAGDVIPYTYTFKNTGGEPLVVNAPLTLHDSVIGNFTCGNNPINLPLGGSAGCRVITYTTSATDVTNKGVTNTVSVLSGTTTPPITNAPSATLTVPLFHCDSTTVYGSGPIPDGSDVTWTITNNAGLPIHIATITITWTNTNSNLREVQLNAISLWQGNGNSGILLPGGPWTLNLGANPLRLLFNPSGTGIKVVVGFTESACNFFVSSGP